MSFAKLFSGITESSLWSEPKEARILFVSMLARADATGFVESSLPGLARMSNLSLEETESALTVLTSPDPHSKDLDENPANEGKRAVKVPGGWCLVNYESYRAKRNEEERREYMRLYMQKHRKQNVNNVSRRKPKQKKRAEHGEKPKMGFHLADTPSSHDHPISADAELTRIIADSEPPPTQDERRELAKQVRDWNSAP